MHEQNTDQRVIRGNCIEIHWRVETCPVGQDMPGSRKERDRANGANDSKNSFPFAGLFGHGRSWSRGGEVSTRTRLISLCHCIALCRFEFCRPCGWHCRMARSEILSTNMFEATEIFRNAQNTMKCAETPWIGKDLAEDCWKSTLVWVPTRSYVYVAKSKTSYTTALQCFAN